MKDWGFILGRYREAFSSAWARRHKDKGVRRKPGESDFLPAVLEVQESPPSPLARTTVYVILSFFIIAILWMTFGKTDIVVTAPGKIIPDERIKVVQAAEGGVVRKILVSDGDHVREGQPLFLLDETTNAADMSIMEEGLNSAILEAEMARILSEPLGENPGRINVEGISEERIARQQEVLNNLHGEQQKRIAKLESDIIALRQRKHGEEKNIANALENIEQHGLMGQKKEESERLQVEKAESLLPLAEKEYESMRDLFEKDAVSELRMLQAKEKYVALLSDLSYRKNVIEEIQTTNVAREAELRQMAERHRNNVWELDANLNALADALALLHSSFRREMADKREESVRRIAEYRQQIVKVEESQRRRQITAPADGIVQQLALHTENGVVQPAQALLVIVPENPVLEIEALLENRDIGFVSENQQAEIKVDAFPYTKYGLLEGVVSHLSPDAIENPNQGLVYQARIRMERDTIIAEGREVRLSPGMSVVVEIKTGKRRIIEFFLSPLLRYRKESLGER